MTSRSHFGSKFQRYQKTWQGEQWENLRAMLEEGVRNDGQNFSDVLFKTK
jgi:hypothetical protein